MYVKIMRYLLLLELIDITSTTTLRANKLIQNICDTLQNNSSFQLEQDQQWKIICQELFFSENDDQYIRKQRDVGDEEDISPKPQLYKAAIRIGGGIRGGSSGIRTGGSGVRTSVGASRASSSVSRFRNSYTGASLPRPNGWQWSRTRLVFLPIATGFFYRSHSSSNRYTTPASSSLTYYYCTSASSDSVEIQCSSADGDNQCCEDEKTHDAFCCGGEIPDYILQDMNRAVRTISRIFYTLAALALFMHLLMRRFYR